MFKFQWVFWTEIVNFGICNSFHSADIIHSTGGSKSGANNDKKNMKWYQIWIIKLFLVANRRVRETFLPQLSAYFRARTKH